MSDILGKLVTIHLLMTVDGNVANDKCKSCHFQVSRRWFNGCWQWHGHSLMTGPLTNLHIVLLVYALIPEVHGCAHNVGMVSVSA